MQRRHASFGLMAIVAAGCHAGNLRSTPRTEAPAISQREELVREKVIQRLNANAKSLDSFQAKAYLTVRTEDGGSFSPDGRIQFQRPRDFKLEMSKMSRRYADIGSNDQGFWVWFDDSKSPQKQYFVGKYDANGTSMAGTNLQPDWIVEVMGLREYTDADLRRIDLAPSSKFKGGWLLTEKVSDHNGQRIIKETEIDGQGLPQSRAMFALEQGRKTPLASATITKYVRVNTTRDDTETPTQAIIPDQMNLVWHAPARLEVTVQMKAPSSANEALAANTFIEPAFRGYQRVSIDDQQREHLADAAEIRESMPAPPTARMSEPEPLGPDGSARASYDPPPLEADLPPLTPEPRGSVPADRGFIRPATPRPPGAENTPADRGAASESGNLLR